MYELLTKALETGKVVPLLQFPSTLLRAKEIAMIEWIALYNRRYGVFPTLERFKKQFPGFIDIPSSDPLEDVYEQTLNNRRNDFAVQLANQILMAEGLGERINLLTSGVQQLHQTENGLAKLTEFDRAEYFREDIISLPFPFQLINNATGGLLRSDFCNIVGRLGTGKTILILWIIKEWLEKGKRILLISNELGYTDIFIRVDAMLAKFNPLLARKEDKSELKAKMVELEEALEKMKGELIIPKERLIKPSMVAAQARFSNVDAIVVDGMYLMQSDEPTKDKYQRISNVSNALKQIAIEMQTPILAVNQLKRESENKDIVDPSDIAFSDSIGQDSDIIIAISELPGGVKSTHEKQLEMQLIKNRGGPEISSIARVNFDTMQVLDESGGLWTV